MEKRNARENIFFIIRCWKKKEIPQKLRLLLLISIHIRMIVKTSNNNTQKINKYAVKEITEYKKRYIITLRDSALSIFLLCHIIFLNSAFDIT